jgi:hypothetical protein
LCPAQREGGPGRSRAKREEALGTIQAELAQFRCRWLRAFARHDGLHLSLVHGAHDAVHTAEVGAGFDW